MRRFAHTGPAPRWRPPPSSSTPDTSTSQLPAESTAPPAATSSPTTLPVSVTISKVHTDSQHYSLDARAPALISARGNGELELVLVAKDGYHLNDAYPYKLHLSSEPAESITFERADLTLEASTRTKTEARFIGRFSGAHEGAGKVIAAFAFSVCTKKECIIDKGELELPVRVKWRFRRTSARRARGAHGCRCPLVTLAIAAWSPNVVAQPSPPPLASRWQISVSPLARTPHARRNTSIGPQTLRHFVRRCCRGSRGARYGAPSMGGSRAVALRAADQTRAVARKLGHRRRARGRDLG